MFALWPEYCVNFIPRPARALLLLRYRLRCGYTRIDSADIGDQVLQLLSYPTFDTFPLLLGRNTHLAPATYL